MPLISRPRIAAGDVLGLVGGRGELDAAGLAATADEDLGLDHDLVGPGGEEAARRRTRASAAVWATSHGGNGQALGDEQRLGVGFLDLHARRLLGSRGAADSERKGLGPVGADRTAMVQDRASAGRNSGRAWAHPGGPSVRGAGEAARARMADMAHRVTLIPGDGIGPELAEATRRVLDATGVGFEWEVQEAGEAMIAEHGTPLPERVLESIRRNKVALKGPITTPVGEAASGAPTSRSARRSACTRTSARLAR